jgi:MFS family permease
VQRESAPGRDVGNAILESDRPGVNHAETGVDRDARDPRDSPGMTLRNATSFLLVGLGYTALHKLAYGLFPSLRRSAAALAITSVLWLVAASAIILFALQFLREISPRDRGVRSALVAVAAFTGAIMVLEIPLGPLASGGFAHRLAFGLARLLNGIAILVFLVSLLRTTAGTSPLRAPIRASIWTCSLTAALGFVSLGFFLAFAFTGHEAAPLPFLRPLSVVAFACTYVTIAWFLVRLRALDDYRDLACRGQRSVRGS